MKRKQKSFNTEQAIIKEIDAVMIKRTEHIRESEEFDVKAIEFIRDGNPENVQHGHWLRGRAEDARAKSARADSILAKLKDALAEFRTITIPGIIEDKFDRQVVLK